MKTLKITKTPKGKIKITDANDFSVCLMSSNVQKENEDMAKLFAAAPELLEALNKIKSELRFENEINRRRESGRNWSDIIEMIDNVIKKAE